jgi:RHS repeat-associated protein
VSRSSEEVSNLQSISRTQATTGTTPIVTTFAQTADGVKNEGRIASITHSGLNGLNTSYAYTWDDHGRVATFTTLAGTRTYGYDTSDQVTGATGGTQAAESFAYDTNGNRTGSGVTVSAFNRVTNDGTYTYLYDNEGNRTRRTKTSNGEYELYVWDYRQRLVSVTLKNSANVTQQTVVYEYDGLNRRIRRTVSNSAGTVTAKQRFLYDSNVLSSPRPRIGGEGQDEGAIYEVVLVLDELASGLLYQQVDHRFMNGPAIDQVFADEGSGSGNQVLWYLSDAQHTVRDVAKYTNTTSGSTAKIRNHLEYDSFGNVTSVDDPTTGANTSDGDLPGLEGTGNEFSPQRSYTGREPDAATGLIYYRARWFDPRLGRFISEDPIGFAAGDANLSRYVGNSTPNAVDPSGLDFVTTEGNMAVWVIEGDYGRNGERIDLGVVEGDTIYLRPSLGGGTVPYSELQEFVENGLSNSSIGMGVSSLNGLDELHRNIWLTFSLSEVSTRSGNPCLRSGDRADEEGNVTHYAGAQGPIAAVLVIEMLRQVAVELALEFGGGKALSVVSHGGKLIFKQGKEVVELTLEEVAKKLGKKADDVNLDDLAKRLDGKKFDDVVRPRRVTNPKHHPNSVSPEPANVDELYDNSLVDDQGRRWSRDPDGTVHRFSKPSNGECHWNGSTAGDAPILQQDIPAHIRRSLK